MSCYEWSHGTIVLPRNEYVSIRREIQRVESARMEQVYEEAQAFWKGLSPSVRRNSEKYLSAVQGVAGKVSDETYWRLQRSTCRRVLRTDLRWPTNKTTVFSDSGVTLTFHPGEHSVTYDVPENNHAREWAERTALHQTFVRLLDRVRWGRGTGGVILGNDEYNRDGGFDMPGGGGSYVVMAFGPEGAAQAPTHVKEFLNSKGERMVVETKVTARGFVPKISKASHLSRRV